MQIIALPKKRQSYSEEGWGWGVGGGGGGWLLKYNLFQTYILVSGFNGNCAHSHLFSCPTPVLISQQLQPSTHRGWRLWWWWWGGLCHLRTPALEGPPRSCIVSSSSPWSTGERSVKPPSTPEPPWLWDFPRLPSLTFAFLAQDTQLWKQLAISKDSSELVAGPGLEPVSSAH
uniref:Uncharacterized protein n=1 Tax=Myotis myotis TaxID=51298 RepID=A0A7J7TTV2_MYOMY|nr:hypothetical protein mMyoMyo1_009004 [Myotis myotis]